MTAGGETDPGAHRAPLQATGGAAFSLRRKKAAGWPRLPSAAQSGEFPAEFLDSQPELLFCDAEGFFARGVDGIEFFAKVGDTVFEFLDFAFSFLGGELLLLRVGIASTNVHLRAWEGGEVDAGQAFAGDGFDHCGGEREP